jgi:GTP-binding protein
VDYASVRRISALRGTGVGAIFDTIDTIHSSREAGDTSSAAISRLLADAVDAHPPPVIRGRRIKLRYAHIGGRDPLRIVVHGNQTRSVPESYRRYLANTFRERLQLVATPVMVEFKYGENPYKGRRNELTGRQIRKRQRVIRRRKSKN